MEKMYLWIPFSIYGIPNLISFYLIANYDLLLVDMIPIELKADKLLLTYCFAAIVLSFVFVWICLNFSIKLLKSSDRQRPMPILGIIIFIFQLILICSVVFFDYGRVGADSNNISILGRISSYFKPDFLFLIYYCHARPKRLPIFNLLLYLVSNTIRGWTGFWLILFFIESYYSFTSSKTKYRARLPYIIVVLGLLSYPIIDQIKLNTRGSVTSDFSYIQKYIGLLNRMQHSTNVVLIAQESKQIKNDVENNSIVAWYVNDSVTQKIFTSNNAIYLQKYLTSNYLIDWGSVSTYSDVLDDLSWNTHIGVAGWIFLIKWYLIPFYLCYVCLSIVVPYWLIGKYIKSKSITPVLHVATFMYVLHGWMIVQTSFITAIVIYILLNKFVLCLRQSFHIDSIRQSEIV